MLHSSATAAAAATGSLREILRVHSTVLSLFLSPTHTHIHTHTHSGDVITTGRLAAALISPHVVQQQPSSVSLVSSERLQRVSISINRCSSTDSCTAAAAATFSVCKLRNLSRHRPLPLLLLAAATLGALLPVIVAVQWPRTPRQLAGHLQGAHCWPPPAGVLQVEMKSEGVDSGGRCQVEYAGWYV